MSYRIEKDTLGELKVPQDKYWGAQTQRSLQNFKIGHERMPIEIIRAFALLKKACANVNGTLHLLSEEKVLLINAVADEILAGKLDAHFPLVVWQTGSGTQTNMNLNEVIANRGMEISRQQNLLHPVLLHPNDDVNMSQSSNDTFPTAMHLAAYQLVVEKLLPALNALRDALEQKSSEWQEIVKIGRTHLMDATPLTLGQEFSGYVAQLDYGIKDLIHSLEHLGELAIGGTAVGTGINAPENFDRLVVSEINRLSNLPFESAPNKFESLAAHDAVVAASAALKGLAVRIMKIANDVRLLASGPRCGIGEITLPANEPGSSIMPGKVNPTQVEAIAMVCAQVVGNDAAITIGGMNGHFELNVFKPMMIDNLIRSVHLLADACHSFTKNCVAGIEPNLQLIQHNLDNSLMLVTALNTHIGYEKAAEIAKKAYADNLTLKQAADQLGYVKPADFDAWVNASKMV